MLRWRRFVGRISSPPWNALRSKCGPIPTHGMHTRMTLDLGWMQREVRDWRGRFRCRELQRAKAMPDQWSSARYAILRVFSSISHPDPVLFRPSGRSSDGTYFVGARATILNIRHVAECGLGDRRQRLTGEEALVCGDQHVGERQQAGEHIVVDDFV